MAEINASGFPRMSLGEAVSRVGKVYAAEHLNPTDNNVVAERMGYSGITGTSLSALASVRKFGLIEGRGEQLRVTKDAQILILDPPDSVAYKEVAEKCLFLPPVFSELRKRFESIPSERSLTAFLEKQGFRQKVAKRAAKSYLDSIAFAGVETYSSAGGKEDEAVNVSPADVSSDAIYNPSDTGPSGQSLMSIGTRTVGSYEFEDGSYVKILVGGEIDTDDALNTAETLISMKRMELKQLSKED